MSESIQLLIIQFLVLLLLFFVILYVLRFNKSFRYEKRIGKYTIDSLRTESSSLFDKAFNLYQKIIKLISKLLLKLKVFNKYSVKYNKYIDHFEPMGKIAMDYVSNKVLVSIVFLLTNVVANVIEYQFPTLFEMLIATLIGFFLPDLLTAYRDYVKRKNVEKEMLNAIIIMNNAFKSGRSTLQAIEIVNNELSGPIKEEFRRMRTEISYGLSLEVVFQRFAERVDLEEVRYITSSLTILNKTGGNIVKVFSSIERSLFSKRKLALELKSLTSSSKAMSKVLLFLPIIFSGIILILSPSYFDPLFASEIGIVALVLIILFYVLYAFLVRKLMKVRM